MVGAFYVVCETENEGTHSMEMCWKDYNFYALVFGLIVKKNAIPKAQYQY